jgi:hypothetical protein
MSAGLQVEKIDELQTDRAESCVVEARDCSQIPDFDVTEEANLTFRSQLGEVAAKNWATADIEKISEGDES